MVENIIETLLWLSREEMAVDQNQVFAVGSVVLETIEQNRYLIVKKPIDVEFVPENEPQLSVPPAILQIALTNLIRNAIQHTAAGKVRVIVKADRVIVSDTGAGMELEDLKLNTQSHGRRDPNKGFGLGLSIVQQLCDRLGWKLEIESKIGLGTTVKLIFQTVKK
jgi:signal transduction histidine kinase